MDYSTWRITFQDSEQAAQAAFEGWSNTFTALEYSSSQFERARDELSNEAEKRRQLQEQITATEKERDQLAASVERLRAALEPFALGGAASCIDREDYSVMRERLKDWTGVSDWKLAISTYEETPPASLAEVKAQAVEECITIIGGFQADEIRAGPYYALVDYAQSIRQAQEINYE